MDNIIKDLQNFLVFSRTFIEQNKVLPAYLKQALIDGLFFVPLLFVLYFTIEIIERFFIKHITFLVKLIKKGGAIFGALISVIPECGFQVIASTFYSRKLITKGTLLAFFISCSDEAYPILFLNPSKTDVLLPIIIIKLIIALLVWVIVDFPIIFMKKATEDPNTVNLDLNEKACCHHKITTLDDSPGLFSHPINHTFNILIYVVIALALYYSAVNSFGSEGAVAKVLFTDVPIIQISACAIFGLIPSCAASVFMAIAYVKGAIGFAAFLAGLVTTTGVGLMTLANLNKKKNADTFIIALILLITGIVVGIVACKMPVPSIPLFVK